MSELTSLQMRVLAAVEQVGRVRVNAHGQPNSEALYLLADAVGEDPETVAVVLDSLHAECALIELRLDFDGIEPVAWWSVHPQLHG